MSYTIRKENEFQFIDEGSGPVLLLLHGLFGALSNWVDVVERFSKNYRVVIPLMPIYTRLALDCGYYDQAHFNHDFREFSGMNPTAYLEKRTDHLGHVPL